MKVILKSTILPLLFVVHEAIAEAPLFAGYTGSEYALESRLQQDFKMTFVGKTFRKELPLWAYFGAYVDKHGADKPFYGGGVGFNVRKRLHMLPTLEGYGKEFTGISGYTSLAFPHEFVLDVIPSLDGKLRYNGTDFNLHKTAYGITVGFGGAYQNRNLTSWRDYFWRVARIHNGDFVDLSMNFGKKKVRIAVQKRLK